MTPRATASRPSVSVVIPTYNRPTYVRTCLEHVFAQEVGPDAVVVVDSSPDTRTEEVIRREFPKVTYLRNPRGGGWTATARGIGLDAVSSEIIAFLDDDAYARPDWLTEVLSPYADPAVGGVGGRVRNAGRDEETVGGGQIGMFLPNGRLIGNFAADPKRRIEVDHLLGANMSFRTRALHDNGGIHDRYPGTCMREESDIALRTRRAGWKLIFNPAAVVDHDEGPYAKGRRFDLRYTYYSHRNHIVLLHEIVGLRSARTRSYVGTTARDAVQEIVDGARPLKRIGTVSWRSAGRSLAAGGARAATIGAGLGAGFAASRRGSR